MRKTLSVVLATFNEEKNLGACLKSLKDIADEIVIVDGTSSDKTVEIAKKYGARVKVTTNKLNFHINKQMAIDMARCDWILQMDADEHVSEELKKEISQILEKDPKEYNGFWIPRKNQFLGKFLMKGGQYPDYTIRLYRKGKGHLPQKDVHEQAEVEGKVGHLKTALLHYPYFSFAHYIKKWDKYNDFFAVQIKEEQSKKNIVQKVYDGFLYLLVRPIFWFFWTYFRHKGFVDSWQGATFSFFSAIRFPVSYIKYVGPFKFFSWCIIILAIFLRFYKFETRWGLGGDDARDAMIALEAIKRHEFPLMGPFSSAGPFVFGGIYYWFIIFSYMVMPFWINAPWVALGIVSVLTVVASIFVGKELGGRRFGLIMGILTATSPQLVDRALMLGPHSFISAFAMVIVLCFLLLFRTKKLIYAFIAGIFLGLSFGFHYQAINLLIFFPAILLVTSLKLKDRFIALLFMIVGFIIPSIPLFYWDAQQGFANVRNMADYILIGQYRIYVPNSWRIFVFQALPGYWSFVIGRYQSLALVSFIVITIFFVWRLLKRAISFKLLLLILMFYIMLFVNRYYHGERSEGYLLYFVPFILILNAWFLTFFISSKKRVLQFLSMFALGLIVVFNIVVDFSYINYQSPVKVLRELNKILYNKFPNSKFSVYDYKYKMYSTSMAVSFLLKSDDKIAADGKKIGFSCYGKSCPEHFPKITAYILVKDLDSATPSDLDKKKGTWVNVNQSSTYDDLIGWLSKNGLKSTFNFQSYIKDKLKF